MNKTKLAIAILISGLVTTNVYATNGYFSHGFGAKEKGMAGAGVALGGSSISAANNPASLLQVGDSMDFGLSLFSPTRSYSVEGGPYLPAGTPLFGTFPGCGDGMGPIPMPGCYPPFSMTPGTVDSDSEWFPMPSFGYSSRIDEDTVWGISLYGNGGMNTDYTGGSARLLSQATYSLEDSPGTFGAGETGVDLMQLFINTSIAYQINETVGVGASIIVAVQAFEAKGLAPFANNSSNPMALTNNGHDTSSGVGIRLGMNIDVTDELTIGLSYLFKPAFVGSAGKARISMD